MKKFYFELDDSNHRRDVNLVIKAETVEEAIKRLQQLFPSDAPEVQYCDFLDFCEITEEDTF